MRPKHTGLLAMVEDGGASLSRRLAGAIIIEPANRLKLATAVWREHIRDGPSIQIEPASGRVLGSRSTRR
jgi:hypothetical protein